MANIASQIKRIKTNEKRNEINKSYKAKIKTAFLKAEVAIKDKNKTAPTLVSQACSLIDKAVIKGIYHINKAANKKSKIMSKLAQTK
ncbi:30S ribosomal protein S20 [Spiroplasma endosymbiont of Virgichneumon dumeticola]|uniref:30S ribosomal protein S20 n=1 Tax=Spiroplasma endosymbiont of Virgichneumon dumeticola TaxID=3139323 RepID=UPI0035C8DDB8